MTVKPSTRSRIETQGFCGLDDAALQELAPWLRWTYALGTLFTVVGVAVMSPTLLWALAAATSVGIVLPFHPFDLLYNYGVRYITGTRPFPKSGPQRRFVFAVASVWLAATGWAFYTGAAVVGFAFGIPLILVGTLASVTHFCIPSTIYNAVVHRRSQPALER
jgi:uncharacterized protein DUF4395